MALELNINCWILVSQSMTRFMLIRGKAEGFFFYASLLCSTDIDVYKLLNCPRTILNNLHRGNVFCANQLLNSNKRQEGPVRGLLFSLSICSIIIYLLIIC